MKYKSPVISSFINNNTLSSIIDDLDIGIIVIVNKQTVYKNKFILKEFGDIKNYLELISREDIHNETKRYHDFINNNIESERTIITKMINSIEKIYKVNFYLPLEEGLGLF